MLLRGRAHRVLSVRARYEAAGAERRVCGTVQLCARGRPQQPPPHGGGGPEPRHPPGLGRQLQV